jgi:hypothetical protein
MSRRVLVVAFDDEHRLLARCGTRAQRARTCSTCMRLTRCTGCRNCWGRPSRLPWACLAGGLVGLTLRWALQVWTSAHDWPLNVGRKPVN